MTNRKNKIELLAPAGSLEAMQAAYRAGADAVYIGGRLFGARAYAENPDDLHLAEAIDLAHLHGRKIYLTVNTLVKEQELQEQLCAYMEEPYRRGLDAVLVQDLGVLFCLHQNFPRLPIHISTQMAVTGPCASRWLASQGAVRLVLPRELSLKEIARLGRETDLELEAFIHGALCYCCSGQCLMSSMIGGRSGNRGRCAQPCRLVYNGRRLMNIRDLCTLEILPGLLSAGVVSLKIEGRMKSARYAAGVAEVYRRYLDRWLADPEEAGMHWTVDKKDMQLLRELYDRGGYSTACYVQPSRPELIIEKEKPPVRRVDEEMLAPLDRYLTGRWQEPVSGSLFLRKGEPARLEAVYGAFSHTVYGAVPEPSRSRPLTEEEVRRRMEKTGNSDFTWSELTVGMDEDVFLPASALNALRREAFDGLAQEVYHAYHRSL